MQRKRSAKAFEDLEAEPALTCKHTRLEMLGHLRAMRRKMSRRVARWAPTGSFIIRPWTGPLSVPHRAVALQIRRPPTWKLPPLSLQPVDFRSLATTTTVERRLAGAFSEKCHVSPNAQATAPVRRLFAEEMVVGCEPMELEGKSMRPALDMFPLEVWNVIAAHVASPPSIQGLRYVAEAARALARLSCTCAPLHEAAAAGWACLGSHVAPILHSALMTSMNPQNNQNDGTMSL